MLAYTVGSYVSYTLWELVCAFIATFELYWLPALNCTHYRVYPYSVYSWAEFPWIFHNKWQYIHRTRCINNWYHTQQFYRIMPCEYECVSNHQSTCSICFNPELQNIISVFFYNRSCVILMIMKTCVLALIMVLFVKISIHADLLYLSLCSQTLSSH